MRDPACAFDRDRRLVEVLDRDKAGRWADDVTRAIRVGVSVFDAHGARLASRMPLDGPALAAAEDALSRLVRQWAIEPDDVAACPAGGTEREEAGFVWLLAPIRSGTDVVGLLALGPRVAAAGLHSDQRACLARLTAGTLAALAPVLRSSLEWIVRAELSRLMISDLHLEAVELDHRELVEANLRLRESEARLEGLAQDLGRGMQEAAEEAARAQREAFQRERQVSLGRMAAGVAHEINNPLAYVASNLGAAARYLDELGPLLGAVRALPVEGEDPAAAVRRLREAARVVDLSVVLADFADVLADAKEGADRVSRIVQDLKAFSRVDRNELSELDLAESLRVAARLIEGRLPAGVRVEVDAPPTFPLCAAGGPVHQALWHLVENAVWALGQGGTLLRLACGISEEGEPWLEVEDDGPGIAEECLPLVFDPFYTTREVGDGAGLGLTVVRDVALAHGGRAEVWSEPGRGARFRLSFSREPQ